MEHSGEYMADEIRDWLKIASSAFKASTTFFENQVQGQIEDNIRMFQNRHPKGSKYNTAFYKNRSKIARPKTRAAGQRFEAALKKAYFSTSDLVVINGRQESNKEQSLSATVNTNLLDYRLRETIPWFKTLIAAGQEAWKSGAVFSYQWWEYKRFPNGKIIDRPRIDLVPPEHIRFDPNADWLDPINTSPYVIRMVPMYLKDVKARMQADEGRGDQPVWKNLDESDLLSAIVSQNITSIESAREDKQADKPSSTAVLNDYSTLWIHENFVELDGQDWVYYTLGTTHMLSDPQPIETVYLHGQRPIVMGHVLIEPFKVFPAGMPEVGQPLQEEINDIANTRLDNVKLVLNKRYFAKRGRNIDMISLLRNTPGSITVMDNPGEDVQVVSTPDITQSSYIEQDRLNVDYDELVGTFSQGSVATNRKLGETVGGLNLIASGAGVINDLLVATFNESWVEPVLKQLLKLEQRYETDITLLSLVSEPEVRRFYIRYGDSAELDRLLDQDLILTVNVGIESTNPQMRVERLMFALDALSRIVASPASQTLEMEEIKKEIFGALGYKDAKRFFKEGEEDPRIAQLQQELLQLQQVINTKQIENQTKLQIEQGKLQLETARLELDKALAELQASKEQATIQSISMDIAKKQIDIQRATSGIDDLYKTEELNLKRQTLVNARDFKILDAQTQRDKILADWKAKREELDAKLKITLVNAGGGVDNNTLNQDQLVEGRQDGGPVTENKPYIVGEQGPELFVPQQDGEVVPNEIISPHQSTFREAENEPKSKQFVFDEQFVNYIKKVEGFIPTAKDIGDGVITGGYGNTTQFLEGDKVSKEKAENLLQEDLFKAVDQVRQDLGIDVFNTLNKNQVQLLSDITFNVGSLKGFPKFTEAILRKDKDMAIKESKRFWKEKGKKKELKNRNKEFSNLINNMLEGEG